MNILARFFLRFALWFNIRRRVHNNRMCAKHGHITCGPYYSTMQAHCRRCGAVNHYAAADDTPTVEPWGEYE